MSLRLLQLGLLLASLVIPTSCSAPAPASLDLAAPDLTVGQFLDDMEDKAQVIVSQAAGAASLVTSKAARDAQLLIQNARQEMHDELTKQWDRLNSDELRILGAITQNVVQLDSEVTPMMPWNLRYLSKLGVSRISC